VNAAARIALALLCWAAAAAAGWWLHRPPTLATAAAPPVPASASAGAATETASPQRLAGRIARADPMGFGRMPAPAGLPGLGLTGSAGAAPAGEVNWRLAAAVVRGQERYVVLTAAEQRPLQVKEGELLPDGDRVLKIDARSVQVRSPRGRLRTLYLSEP